MSAAGLFAVPASSHDGHHDEHHSEGTLTHNVAAERSVLGAMMLDGRAITDVLPALSGDAFYQPAHELVFEAITALHAHGGPVDVVTVSAELTRRGDLTRAGGAPYLHTLIASVPTTASAGHYARIVADRAALRRLAVAGTRIAQLGHARTGGDVADIARAAQAELAAALAGAPDSGGQADTTSRRLTLTPASAIELRPVHWTWTDRIPAGSITVIPGREGIGKSLTLAWLAGQLTRGTLPGIHYGTPRAVIYAATEDSWGHTIAPRLLAAGADLDMVYRIEVDADGLDGQLTLPTDCDALAVEINRLGVGLLAADPLLSLIHGSIDTHRDRDLRKALEPLAKLADNTNCAVVGLAHFNKSASTDALSLITGSRAFSAVARAVLAIARDDSTEDGTCVMSQAKNNLGRTDLPSLTYRIDSHEIATPEGPAYVGRLVFTGESDRSVNDILADSGDGGTDRQERSAAAAWLADYLASRGGEAARADVLKAARPEGFSDRTLQRSHRAAGVITVRQGFPAVTLWRLDISNAPSPDQPQSRQPRQSRQDSERGATGATGRISVDPAQADHTPSLLPGT